MEKTIYTLKAEPATSVQPVRIWVDGFELSGTPVPGMKKQIPKLSKKPMATSATTARHTLIALSIVHEQLAKGTQFPEVEFSVASVESLIPTQVKYEPYALAIAMLAYLRIRNEYFQPPLHFTWLEKNFKYGYQAGFYLADLQMYYVFRFNGED